MMTGKPDDQAAKTPNFHVVAVNHPDRLGGRFMIIGAFDDFGRPRNAVLRVDKIGSVCGHGAAPLPHRRERKTLSHRRPKVAAGGYGVVASETLVSKDVPRRHNRSPRCFRANGKRQSALTVRKGRFSQNHALSEKSRCEAPQRRGFAMAPRRSHSK